MVISTRFTLAKKIRVNKVDVLCIIVFAICMEFLYSPGSGTYNSFILAFLCFYLGSYNYKKVLKKKATSYAIICIFTIIFVGVRGDLKEAIRYMLTLCIVLLMRMTEFREIRKIHVGLVAIGSLRTLIMYLSDPSARAVGFMTGSPTIYSFVICISLYYFLMDTSHKKSDYLFCFLALTNIYLSQSRSTLLAGLAMVAYVVCKNFLQRHKRDWPIALTVLMILVIVLGIISLEIIDLKEFMTSRPNAVDSTNTRIGMIRLIVDQILGSIHVLLIGKGAGYTVHYINSTFHALIHLPLHQDILMLLCEFGIIGFSLICFVCFYKSKMDFIMWMLLFLGTFHNIVISPISILVFMVTARYFAFLKSEQTRQKSIKR